MTIREIVYRLQMGEQGARLRHLAVLGGQRHRIARAVERQKEFHRPLRIDRVAQELGMSASSFHHQFKVVTGMSPLQFQKLLRLQEARRLLLGDGRIPGGLRQRLALQPGVQAALRRTPGARRRTTAGSRAGERPIDQCP